MKKIATLVGLTVLLGACGSETSGSFETEDGGEGTYTVDQENGGGSISIKTDDGEFNMTSGEDVVVELPAGFTVYPGADVVTQTNADYGEGSTSSVMMTSDDSVADMVAHYRKQAEAAGIEITSEMKVNETQIIGGESDDGLTFSFNAAPDEDGTVSAQVTLTRKKGE